MEDDNRAYLARKAELKRQHLREARQQQKRAALSALEVTPGPGLPRRREGVPRGPTAGGWGRGHVGEGWRVWGA